jgi:uncharacterized iron-regulated protein
MKFALLAIAAVLSFAQTRNPEVGKAVAMDEHYRIYRGDGTAATMDQLFAASGAAEVTFVGELHNDPVAHYLEKEFLRATWDPRLALSLEMFERDVQYVLDEYLADLITEPDLIASGRAWKNYASDYGPLVEFAKEKRMPVIAANAPRRYVDRVSRLGEASLDQIEPEGRRFLPPLPYANASEAYAARFVRAMKEHPRTGTPIPDSIERSLEAQSLWDASMAYSIAEFLRTNPGSRILQVNGSFHTSHQLGVVEHLLRYRPQTRVLVVTIVRDKSFPTFDAATMYGEGEFVVVTDPSVPRAFRSATSSPLSSPK